MRKIAIILLSAGLILFGVSVAQAFVSSSANDAKFNAYAVIKQAPSQAQDAKFNAYAVIKQGAGQAQDAKFNAYVVIAPAYPTVRFSF